MQSGVIGVAVDTRWEISYSHENTGSRTIIKSQIYQDGPPNSFSYELLGVTPSGIIAILTREHGGGTGIFHDIVFAVLTKMMKIDGYVDYVLVYLGQENLGDRPIGTDKIVLTGHELQIGRLTFTQPRDDVPERRIKLP
jgi:hypothetical protein